MKTALLVMVVLAFRNSTLSAGQISGGGSGRKADPHADTSGRTTPASDKEPQASPLMIVDDVLKMIEAKLPEEIIAMRVRQNGIPFEMSTTQLIALNKAGASAGLLAVLMDPKRRYEPPKANSASGAEPGASADSGGTRSGRPPAIPAQTERPSRVTEKPREPMPSLPPAVGPTPKPPKADTASAPSVTEPSLVSADTDKSAVAPVTGLAHRKPATTVEEIIASMDKFMADHEKRKGRPLTPREIRMLEGHQQTVWGMVYAR
jgi:hypothetical protein